MPGIKSRLEALSAAVWAWKERHDIPYEDLDPLSQSLVDLARELDNLDTVEKKTAYCEAHGWNVEELERMIQAFAALDSYPAK